MVKVEMGSLELSEKQAKRNLGQLHIGDIFDLTRQKLNGHYQYYGITDNSYMIGQFSAWK